MKKESLSLKATEKQQQKTIEEFFFKSSLYTGKLYYIIVVNTFVKKQQLQIPCTLERFSNNQTL